MAISISRSLFLSAASVALVVGVAEAGPKKRAPITFAGTQSPASNTQTGSQAVTPDQLSVTQTEDARTARLEFRYPDQPDTYYGAQGSRAVPADTAPLAFSSAKSAIATAEAQQYAALSPAATLAPSIEFDPAITPGGFDARAAAATVAAKSDVKDIRVTAKGSEVAVPVGQPLTLSKVRANSEATLTEEQGRAGVYADGFDGKPTANGEIYDETAMMAAHPSLPLPSLVQVINRRNNREIVVRVNDRGPFSGSRAIDLSPHAAEMLGFDKGQTADVTIRYLGPAPVQRATPDYRPNFASDTVTQQPMPPIGQQVYQAPKPEPVKAQAVAYAPPVVSSPDASNGYFIQAGSFSDIGNAQRLTLALGRKLPVEITQARVRNADYFRVMIGPFPTRAQADTYRVHLRDSGITDGFIVEK